jgi:tetratricopeptide (TPR) repeat protein
MKTHFILFNFLISSIVLAQNDYGALIGKGDSLYQAKDYPTSVAFYEKAFQLKKDNPSDLYNAACSAALSGMADKSFELLDLAFKNGWSNVRHLKQDRAT